MPDGLWWVPSLVVFGATAVIVFIVVTVVRMSRRRRLPSSSGQHVQHAELDRRSGLALVRADDAVRRAAEEYEFARAQFGDRAAADLARAVDHARASLRDAFRLRQRLHDEIPDTPAQVREWNGRILQSCADVVERLDRETGAFEDRRHAERTAPERAATLRASIVATAASVTEAARTLDRLRRTYRQAALTDVRGAPADAENALNEAERAIDSAEQQLSRQEPASATLDAATNHLLVARRSLTAVARTASALDQAQDELARLTAETRLALAEARAVRDSTTAADARVDLARAIDHVTGILTAVNARTTLGEDLPDPIAQLALVQRAGDLLDSAMATSRSQEQRLENARAARRGALFSARSHIDSAAAFIDSHRAGIGADARTRLTEAQRQLALAEAADDPVEALDTARRASRIAQDADALARYDAGPRSAPVRGTLAR